MGPPLPALAPIMALVLGIALAGQPDYCSGTCPVYRKIYEGQGYEVREYEQSVWMCSEVKSTSNLDVLAARNLLASFRDAEGLSDDTWPGMIEVKEVDGAEEYEMCWLVEPNRSDGLTGRDQVTVRTIPKVTMFVRIFEEKPSLEGGLANMKKLEEDLKAAGEAFDSSIHYAVGYESYFSYKHHNEIWIPKK